MESFVLSVIGADRAGLVEALAAVVADAGGSWERSRMTELGGAFAGVVLVSLPPEAVERFPAALETLREQGLLEVALRPAGRSVVAPGAVQVSVEVTGADRAGIVHEVSQRLADLDVGIVELETWTESAAHAGGTLFRASAVVALTADTSRWDVAAAVEDLADDLMVDVEDVSAEG